MKQNICLSIIIFTLCLTACGSDDKVSLVSASESASTESMSQTASESSTADNAEQMTSELPAVDNAEQSTLKSPTADSVEQTTVESATSESKESITENSEIVDFDIHMTNILDLYFELDIENKYIMTKEHVEVRGIPDDRGQVNSTLSYQLVEVVAAVRPRDREEWTLVSCSYLDSYYANRDCMGWVKVADLMEYGEENYKLLTYPVSVKEACTDIETGEVFYWEACKVVYEEAYARVIAAGDREHQVAVEDIVHPPFEKQVEETTVLTEEAKEFYDVMGGTVRDGRRTLQRGDWIPREILEYKEAYGKVALFEENTANLAVVAYIAEGRLLLKEAIWDPKDVTTGGSSFYETGETTECVYDSDTEFWMLGEVANFYRISLKEWENYLKEDPYRGTNVFHYIVEDGRLVGVMEQMLP